MKRLICLLIILTMCIALPLTAYADNDDYEFDTSYFHNGIKGKGTETNLSLLLTDDYYRDRLSSVYVQDTIASVSYVTIFIVEGYEEIKHEIIELLSPKFVIQFHYTIYSLSQKQAAFDEILGENDDKILSMAFSADYIGIEIIVAAEDWFEYYKKLTQKYGFFISVNPFVNIPDLSDGIPGQGTLENPEEYWEENGYPDNISFAFEGGSMLEDGVNYAFWIIGIVNANETDKQVIIDLLAPTCLITFEDSLYSYNERKIAYDGILALEDENIIAVILLSNMDKVLVIVEEEDIKHYDELLTAQFGGMVWVSEDIRFIALDGSGWNDILPPVSTPEEIAPGAVTPDLVEPLLPIGGIEVTSPGNEANPFFWVTLVIILLLCGVAALFIIRRYALSPAMQTTNGDIVSGTAPVKMGKKQIQTAIKDSTKTPSDNVYTSLMERIDKKRE